MNALVLCIEHPNPNGPAKSTMALGALKLLEGIEKNRVMINNIVQLMEFD